MGAHSRLAGFSLVHLLLLVTAGELAFNRLASKELPGGPPDSIPLWHLVLDRAGLFLMYFASTLAIGIIGRELWRLYRRRPGMWPGLRWVRLALVGGFLLLALFNLAEQPDERGSFWFEGSFVAVVGLILAELLARPGDPASKVGTVVLAIPLLIPFYGPLSAYIFDAGEVVWSDQPAHLGQWTMVIAALLTPYCFAPRPFMQAAARFGPLVVAAFVGTLGVIILRRHYEVGMRLAHHGLGIDIGPGAPTQFLMLYLLALATVTWTVTACLSAESQSRRDIGVGISLLVVGGYGFAWPLQYLVSAVGLLTIAKATLRVRAEENTLSAMGAGVRPPPIADEVWMRYVQDVEQALAPGSDTGVTAYRSTAMVTEYDAAPGDVQPLSLTTLVSTRNRVATSVHIVMQEGSVLEFSINCGALVADGAERTEPVWTLYALPEKLLGIGAHPEPPRSSAPVVTVAGDRSFTQRFRIRDAGGYTDRLFDEGLRARTAALVDGWMAFWDGRGLTYCVQPGQGAPLDHPVPISLLAFRGTADAEIWGQRIVALVDLLAEITLRGCGPEHSQPDLAQAGSDAELAWFGAVPDATADAAPDAVIDAAPDAVIDAAPDAVIDAAPDAAVDAAPAETATPSPKAPAGERDLGSDSDDSHPR